MSEKKEMMEIRTVELEDGELYLNKEDLLEFLMVYSEQEDVDLVQIMIIRELYDVIKMDTDFIQEFCIEDEIDYDE